MRMVNAEVEGTKGKAAVYRRSHNVVIEVDGEVIGRTKGQVWEFTANASEPQECIWLARDLQVMLDGDPGTQDEIAKYVQLINCFAD